MCIKIILVERYESGPGVQLHLSSCQSFGATHEDVFRSPLGQVFHFSTISIFFNFSHVGWSSRVQVLASHGKQDLCVMQEWLYMIKLEITTLFLNFKVWMPFIFMSPDLSSWLKECALWHQWLLSHYSGEGCYILDDGVLAHFTRVKLRGDLNHQVESLVRSLNKGVELNRRQWFSISGDISTVVKAYYLVEPTGFFKLSILSSISNCDSLYYVLMGLGMPRFFSTPRSLN